MLTAVEQILLADLGNAIKDLRELDVYRPSLFTHAGRPDVNGGRRGGASAGRGDGPGAAQHLTGSEGKPQQCSHGSSRHLRGGGSLTGCEGREAVGH